MYTDLLEARSGVARKRDRVAVPAERKQRLRDGNAERRDDARTGLGPGGRRLRLARYVASYAGRSQSAESLNTTVLSAVDRAGSVIWRRMFPGHPYPPRVDADGTVWVVHRGGGSPDIFTMSAVGADGAVLCSVTPRQEPPGGILAPGTMRWTVAAARALNVLRPASAALNMKTWRLSVDRGS